METDKLTQEIHLEIDLAQERLLNEALEIIRTNKLPDVEAEKANRLKLLGFINTNLVKRSEAANRLIVTSKTLAEGIAYYKEKYPELKFLTEEELLRICNKYNLVYAPVSRYLNDVPNKNLVEIETAQRLESHDHLKQMCNLEFKYFDYVPKDVRKWFDEQEFLFSEVETLTDAKLRDLCPHKYPGKYLYNSGGKKIIQMEKSSDILFIAAPPSHFDLSGLTRHKDKFGFLKQTITVEPKDPIVFRFVKGGLQILSKWGIESKDEIFQGEKKVDNSYPDKSIFKQE